MILLDPSKPIGNTEIMYLKFADPDTVVDTPLPYTGLTGTRQASTTVGSRERDTRSGVVLPSTRSGVRL